MKESNYNFRQERYTACFEWREYRQVIEWCTEQFGSRTEEVDVLTRWYSNYFNTVFFRDEQDYILFLLRWQ